MGGCLFLTGKGLRGRTFYGNVLSPDQFGHVEVITGARTAFSGDPEAFCLEPHILGWVSLLTRSRSIACCRGKWEVKKKMAKGRALFRHLAGGVGVVFALLVAYLGAAVAAEEIWRVNLVPRVLWNPAPREVVLSNPNHSPSKRYKPVSPRELQELLDTLRPEQFYQVGVYDCSDRSVELARFLQEKHGYDTSVIGDDAYGHAWVYVWVGKNKAWAIETVTDVAFARGSAGEIVGDSIFDIVFLGRWLDAKAWSLSLTGYELYYPTKPRRGLHVLEWNQVGKGR